MEWQNDNMQTVAASEPKIGTLLGLQETEQPFGTETGYQEDRMSARKSIEDTGTNYQESFLTMDDDTGELRTANGERAGIITADLFCAMCDAIHEKVGEEVRDVLYNAGAEWGRREFLKFEAEAENKKLYHIRNMGLSEFKSSFNEVLLRCGWGEFDIEERSDFIFIHLQNSAYSEMVAQNNIMYNDLFAGFFAGFFSELIGVDFDSVEVGFVKENMEGIYLLADESVVMSVRNWIENGRTYDQIIRSLEKHDHKKRKGRSADVKETYSEELD